MSSFATSSCRELTRLALGAIVLAACSRATSSRVDHPTAHALAPAAPEHAAAVIDGEAMLATIRTLASDEFEGRAPATAGEVATVRYLVERFERLGLEPGNPDGTFLQKVPLVAARAEYRAEYTIGGRRIPLAANRDIVATSHRLAPDVVVRDSEMVFVGHGVVAPDYGWDDFKDVDVRGKTIVVLVNDPQVPDPADPSRLDPAFFKGKGLTYFGRHTYKYEEGARRGAAAVLLVHQAARAPYPFPFVVNLFGGETFDLARDDRNRGSAAVDGWLSEAAARAMLKDAGEDLDALERAAVSPKFRPVPLKTRLSVALDRHPREVLSQNVVAKVKGTDPDRYLVYSAHWDHLGRDPGAAGGPAVFHGAVDNASGVAALLETAKAFRALAQPPRATLVFLATTAEEHGLLGAKYYTEHPLYPLERTLADINYDGMNVVGKTRDLGSAGTGTTSLEDDLRSILATHGRSLAPERDPENGWSYRTDAFEFARAGVPSIWYRRGLDVIGKPEGFGLTQVKEYVAHDYHQVTDTIHPDWDLSGAVDDVRIFFELGHRLATSDAWPTWKPQAEFRRARAAR